MQAWGLRAQPRPLPLKGGQLRVGAARLSIGDLAGRVLVLNKN